ncbi:MAG: flippase [Bacteroidia bacterium]|nr:flippase [Bacteroidia bacterium]
MKLISKFLQTKGKNELLTGSIITFFLRIAGMGAGYIFSLQITRNYGADAWGMFSLTFTVFSFGAILSTFGLDGAILRLVPELVVKKQLIFLSPIYRKLALLGSIISLATMMAIYLLSKQIAITLFDNKSLIDWIKYSALLVLPITLCNINSQLLRGLKKIKEYVFLDMVARFLFPAILVFVFQQLGMEINLIFTYFLGMLLVTFLSFFLLIYEFRKLDIRPTRDETYWNNYLKLTNLAYPLLFSSTLIFLKGWIDTIMLGHYRTEAEVGIYNIFLKVTIIATIPITSLNSIGMPKFGELFAKNDLVGLQKTLRFSASIIFLSTFTLALGLLLFHSILLGFFGKDFSGDKTAFYILLITQVVSAFGGSSGYILQMTGHQNSYKNAVIGTLVITILSNYYFIPLYGIVGAAISTLLTTIFYNFFLVQSIRKHLKVDSTFFSFIQSQFKR